MHLKHMHLNCFNVQEINSGCEIFEEASTAGETSREGGQALESFCTANHSKTETEELQTDNKEWEGETWELGHHFSESEETAEQDPGRW